MTDDQIAITAAILDSARHLDALLNRAFNMGMREFDGDMDPARVKSLAADMLKKGVRPEVAA